MASGLLEKDSGPDGTVQRLKLMDRIINTRRPQVVGRFQHYAMHLGKPGAMVKFPGKKPHTLLTFLAAYVVFPA